MPSCYLTLLISGSLTLNTEISRTVGYKSMFGCSKNLDILNSEILQCLSDQRSSTEKQMRNYCGAVHGMLSSTAHSVCDVIIVVGLSCNVSCTCPAAMILLLACDALPL